jgi:predicted PurR-regulated permease PerM
MKQLLGEWPVRLLVFAAVAATLVMLYFSIQILLVPFVAAVFLLYLFDPAIVPLQRRGMDRGNAFLLILSASVIAIMMMIMLAPSWLLVESIGSSSQTFTERLQGHLTALESRAKVQFPMIRAVNIADAVTRRAGVLANEVLDELPTLATSFLVNLILVPFIAYFMVRDGKSLKRKIIELVPNRFFEMSLIMFDRIDKQIGGYLRGRLIECVLVGIIQMLAMGIAALFVPQPQILLISAVAGTTSLIPYLGPILGAIFGIFLYLGAGLPITSVYGLLIAVIVAHVADNVFIAPTVLSNNVDLHPLTVALVLVVGGELMGALGLLIAVPIAASFKVVGQEFYRNYQVQMR